MLTKKAWIVTKKGIAFTKRCTAAAALGAFCWEVCPNTILLPFKRARQEEALEAKLGLKELPYQVQEFVRRAIDDMKFTEDQRKTLSVYLTDLNDVETLGNINSIFGTLVKLPWMLWNHYPIPESLTGECEKHPEATKQYLESLQWSDKAKLYFTAYQVAWTKQYQFLAQGIFNAVGITSVYAACYLFNSSKYRVTDNVAALAVFNFVLVGLFFVSWTLATDMTTCENEEEIMKEVCSLGPDYAEGAVELYKKFQQHNAAIRQLGGFPGKILYTEEGNARSFRRYTIPIIDRLAIAENCLENHQYENKPSSNKEEEKK